jgi:uncharacterized NAD-dependent epimerase/dehydratase family protein
VSSPRRLLILAEGYSGDAHYGKTARGVVRYRRDEVVAILDSDHAGEAFDGIPIVARVGDSLTLAPTTALVGIATQGGRFPPAWRALLGDCIAAGLDVESGLHEFIGDDAEFVELAARHRVTLRDLRRPPADLGVPTGANLSHDAHVVLTVGSDCAVLKMTVALELTAEAQRRGIRSEFVPTGQTGVAIAGWGMSIDAVVADFLAGAAERLVLDGRARGGRFLVVEGQGSLLHPAYAGVSLGLMHGAAPHSLVLCHRAGQRYVDGNRRFPIPTLPELIELHERSALLARPAKVVAVALNTREFDELAARRAIDEASTLSGLPSGDPVRFGPAAVTDAILAAAGRPRP